MKTDIEIAQEAVLENIVDVAGKIGIEPDDLELYGKYKAKISDACIERIKDNPDGRLILVTAINPTPAGEGKTTTSIGLGQAFGAMGKKAILALREPYQGRRRRGRLCTGSAHGRFKPAFYRGFSCRYIRK